MDEQLRMQVEHQAWLDFCKEFERLTLTSINEKCNRALVARIRIWGEELATLRRVQPEEYGANVVQAEQLVLGSDKPA